MDWTESFKWDELAHFQTCLEIIGRGRITEGSLPHFCQGQSWDNEIKKGPADQIHLVSVSLCVQKVLGNTNL